MPEPEDSFQRSADRIIASVIRDLIIASITVIVLVTLMMFSTS
jgi:hypothetical protein